MTTIEFNRLSKGHESHHVRGWTVSMLCHLIGIGVVLLIMGEIEKPVLPNTFQWEIAMMEPSPTAESKPATAAPTPVVQRQSERSIDSVPSIETADAIQQPIRDAPSPVEAVVERVAVQATVIPQVVTQSVSTNHESAVEQTASKLITDAVIERVEPAAEQTTVAYATNVKQAEPIERESSRFDSQLSEIEHRVVQHRVVKIRQTQTDYGWLRDALWGRIEELKRYPAQARANHWEGKVVVEVVIREDGTVVNLHVAESSGRAILDQEALAVMRKASPLTLKHPLGQPSVTLLVPISYKLDG